MRVEFWSDVVCPWCYVGKRRFEQAMKGFAHAGKIELIHRSFQLDPNAAKGKTEPTSELLMKKYRLGATELAAMQGKLKQTAAAEGLNFQLEHTESGNTENAHRLLHEARLHGVENQLLEAMYSAYFCEQKSLFDEASLLALSRAAGVPDQAAQQVLASDKHAAEVRADGEQARAFGASGVPFFVIDGKYGISGAQPAALIQQALERAWSEHAPLDGASDGEVCEDGICATPSN